MIQAYLYKLLLFCILHLFYFTQCDLRKRCYLLLLISFFLFIYSLYLVLFQVYKVQFSLVKERIFQGVITYFLFLFIYSLYLVLFQFSVFYFYLFIYLDFPSMWLNKNIFRLDVTQHTRIIILQGLRNQFVHSCTRKNRRLGLGQNQRFELWTRHATSAYSTY